MEAVDIAGMAAMGYRHFLTIDCIVIQDRQRLPVLDGPGVARLLYYPVTNQESGKNHR